MTVPHPDKSFHHPATPRDKVVDIGDGLIMRWSTSADADNVADLVAEAFKWISLTPHPDGVVPGPNEFFRAGARRLLSGKNATMTDLDYALVEDTKRRDIPGKNPIVACVSMHRVRAYYGSVDLFFGKPELIASSPEYRNRGLVRKLLFEMIHPESEARGDALQFIPGIPHFYRQFGYEYAMATYTAGRIENISSALPSLPEGESELFTLRKATPEDIPFLIRFSTDKKRVSPQTQVGLYYGPEYWNYTVRDIFEIADPKFPGTRDTQIIVSAATGKDVGFTIISSPFGMKIEAIVLDDSVVLQEALFPILRQAVANEKQRLKLEQEKAPSKEEADKINVSNFSCLFQIHPDHPATALLGSRMRRAHTGPGFRIYVRILDYPKFILQIAPELERRLAASPIPLTTGRLRLNFYRKVEGNNAKGLEIVLEKGKVKDAREWANPGHDKTAEEFLKWKADGTISTVYSASLAPLTFNTLIMGERSFEELTWAYGETEVKNDESKLLINTLFPKTSHHIDTFFW
ncbi:hypothetical protein EDD11_002768 [Mortierella claussenii]|nr:hypothetical protein EDD11_002768 [Mortierella claussenii]